MAGEASKTQSIGGINHIGLFGDDNNYRVATGQAPDPQEFRYLNPSGSQPSVGNAVAQVAGAAVWSAYRNNQTVPAGTSGPGNSSPRDGRA